MTIIILLMLVSHILQLLLWKNCCVKIINTDKFKFTWCLHRMLQINRRRNVSLNLNIAPDRSLLAIYVQLHKTDFREVLEKHSKINIFSRTVKPWTLSDFKTHSRNYSNDLQKIWNENREKRTFNASGASFSLYVQPECNHLFESTTGRRRNRKIEKLVTSGGTKKPNKDAKNTDPYSASNGYQPAVSLLCTGVLWYLGNEVIYFSLETVYNIQCISRYISVELHFLIAQSFKSVFFVLENTDDYFIDSTGTRPCMHFFHRTNTHTYISMHIYIYICCAPIYLSAESLEWTKTLYSHF